MTPRVILASENIELAGLLLVALARLQAAGQLEVAAVWSNLEEYRSVPLPPATQSALKNATTSLPPLESGGGVILGGVPVSDFSQLCAELGLPYHNVPDVNARHVAATVTALRADLGIICGHSQFLRRAVRRSPRLGWVNLHPSLLPRHRGPYPGFWELRDGDQESGISLHQVTGSFDSGPLLAQASFPITPGMRFAELLTQQAALAAGPILDAVLNHATNGLPPRPQDESLASYQPAPVGEDFVLDSRMSCQAMAQFVSGMQGVAPVLVRIEDQLMVVESVTGWQETASPSCPTDQPTLVAPDTVRMPAWNGEARLLVRPVSAADLGLPITATN